MVWLQFVTVVAELRLWLFSESTEHEENPLHRPTPERHVINSEFK